MQNRPPLSRVLCGTIIVLASVWFLPPEALSFTDIVITNNLEINSSSTWRQWSPWLNWVANPAPGVYLALHHADTSADRVYLLASTDYGETWSMQLVPGTTSPSQWWLDHIKQDTCMIHSYDSDDEIVAVPVAGTTLLDSSRIVDAQPIENINRQMLFREGSRWVVTVHIDALSGLPADDSSYLLIADSDEWDESYHLGPVLNASKTGYGFRMQCWLGNGFGLAHLISPDNDLIMMDTTNGFRVVQDNNFLTHIIGGAAGQGGTHDIIITDDSTGLMIYQCNITTGADSVLVRNWTLTDYVGTPAVSFGPITRLATEAVVRDGSYVFPRLSWAWGTDIAMAYWLQWADTASADSADVMISVTIDRGNSWSTPAVWRQADVTDPRFRLQTPRWLIPHGSGDIQRVVFATGSATVDDTLHFMADTLFSDQPSPTGTRVIVISQ